MVRNFLLVLLITCGVFGYKPATCAAAPPPPNTPGYCDSLNTAINNYYSAYGSNYSLTGLISTLGNTFGQGYYDSLGIFITYDFGYWQSQFSACGIACPPVVNCGLVQNLMSNFISQNPEYANSCPPFLWANYLAQTYGYGYTATQWMQILNCCGISYPTPVAANSYCDTLIAVINQYNSGSVNQNNASLWQLEYMLGQVFGGGYYDSIGFFHNYDLVYWQDKFNMCGIACPQVVNCGMIQNLMNNFVNQNPQYISSCPPFLWASYLHLNTGYSYSTADWGQLLTCCGIAYPTPVTLNNNCDSLNALVSLYISSSQGNYGVGSFESIFQNVYGWGYMSSGGQYVVYDLSHWLNLLSACDITCPPLTNCSYAQSLMSNFYNQFPQYGNSCAPVVWVDYLNQYMGGNSVEDWQHILTCCGITYPAPVALLNYCDTLNAAVNVYLVSYLNNYNVWNFQYNMSKFFGSGYTDSTGTYINYDLNYWRNQLAMCGIACPPMGDCNKAQYYMSSFITTNPQYANSCPPFLWVDYFNQNWGYGYNASDWQSVLTCCGVSFPTPDTFANYCDTVNALVNMYNDANSGNHNINNFYNIFVNTFGKGYRDSAGNFIYYDLTYWVNQLTACGIACPQFVQCSTVQSILNNFFSQNPQYASHCPAVIWTTYLNQNYASGYSAADWEQVLRCCGISFPTPDTLPTYCDSLNAYVNVYTATTNPAYYSMYTFQNILTQFYGYGYYDNSGNYISYDMAYWKNQLSMCGIACPPLADCNNLAALMTQFTSQYPQYAVHCSPLIWSAYLSQNYQDGSYSYKASDWEQILQCCGINYPMPDSLATYCDSLSTMVGLYIVTNSNGYSIWQFENTLAQYFGYGYVDSTGNYVNYDLAYWEGKLAGCGISCPPLASCNQLQGLMNTFATNNPQYAHACPAFLWIDYLNNNTGYGYGAGDWRQVLQCCGIAYPAPDTLTSYCDSLNAVVGVYANIYRNQPDLGVFESMLGSVFNNWHIDSTGNYVNNDLAYWKTQLSMCGLGCPPLIQCDTVQKLLNNFTSTYPQYASSCPVFVWTNYLNWCKIGRYSSSDWIQLMNCCGIAYPTPDTLGTYCDTLAALVNIYTITHQNNYNFSGLEKILSIALSTGITTTDGYVNYTYAYWTGQFSQCGIACPPIVNCAAVQRNLGTFFALNPQYADSCPVSVWASYLNTIEVDSFGYINWIDPTDWPGVLNCCGISFPRPDSLSTFCDTLSQALAQFNTLSLQQQNTNLFAFQDYMQNALYAKYDDGTGNYITADYNYWMAQITKCNLPCPLIVNCAHTDSMLYTFIAQNSAAFNGQIPDFIWSNYLNYNGAGNGNWYTAPQWRLLLQCCGMPAAIATPDSVTTFCDSLSAVLNLFNGQLLVDRQRNNNLGVFEQDLGEYISWGYNTPSGGYVNYPYTYWAAALDSCHLPRPVFVSCTVIDSLMADFLATAPPQYRDTCPAILWAVYFNQAYFGQSNGGYKPEEWLALAEGCNITFPVNAGLPTKCDSLAALISTVDTTGKMPIMQVVNMLFSVAGMFNNIQDLPQIKLANWLAVLDSCGYNCNRFMNCTNLNTTLNQLYANYPQYRDSCPVPVLSEYLNQALGNQLFGGYKFTYADWVRVASCCNTTLPHPDTAYHFCDTMFFMHTLITEVSQTQPGCLPAWLFNVGVFPALGFTSVSQVCPLLPACGFSCADTCTNTDLTFCDSIRSVYLVYHALQPSFSTLLQNDNLMVGVTQAYLGYALTYGQVMAKIDSCGPVTGCKVSATLNISDTIFCPSDSTCFHITGGARCVVYADSANGEYMFSGATPINYCGALSISISSGYHRVVAIIYSADSACTDTLTGLIYIKPYCACGVTVDTCPELVANFGYTIYPGYVILKDKSTGNPTIVEWYVNGQNFVTGPGDTLKYVFAHSGLFEVCQTIHYLIYGSDRCCLKDTCMYIMGSVDTCLLLNLTADFTYTPSKEAPYSYTFTPIWPANATPSVITWNFGDSTSTYSDTAVQATHNFDTAGYYDVCVNEIWFLPGNYCCIDSQCYRVYVGGVQPDVRVSPNPFQQTITVQFQVNNAGKVELLVFDALGKVTKTLIISTYYPSGYYTMEFDLSELTDALYHYRFRSADGMFTGKMIKQ